LRFAFLRLRASGRLRFAFLRLRASGRLRFARLCASKRLRFAPCRLRRWDSDKNGETFPCSRLDDYNPAYQSRALAHSEQT
jgi:hypothetical protein